MTPSVAVRNAWLASSAALIGLVVLVLVPPVVGFCAAVGGALFWCRWIDEHPEA